MKAKMDFIMLMYAFFTDGVALCSMSVDLLGWNYSVTKVLSFVIACFGLCFAINVFRQNTACWKRKALTALVFLTGFGIMALVIRFFGTSVSACMLAVLAIIGCFLFLANKITEVIELIKEGDSKNENDSIFEKGTE